MQASSSSLELAGTLAGTHFLAFHGKWYLVLTTIAAITFVCLAFWRWSKQIRGEGGRWRGTVGLASILLTLLGWSALHIPPILGSRDSDWVGIPLLLLPICIGLSFAMKGSARILVLLANLSMILLLWGAVQF